MKLEISIEDYVVILDSVSNEIREIEDSLEFFQEGCDDLLKFKKRRLELLIKLEKHLIYGKKYEGDE